MKKKLALLLAAVMVAAMVPVSAFAKSDNRVTNTLTMKAKDETTAYAGIPSLIIEEDDALVRDDQFELTLAGAEWKIKPTELASWVANSYGTGDYYTLESYDFVDSNGYLKVGGRVWYGWTETTTDYGYYVLLVDANTVSVTVDSLPTTGVITLPIQAKVTGEEGTITIDPCDSKVSAGTYTFARTTTADATVKTNGMVDVELKGAEKALKSIVITETVKGALKNGEVIKVKLYGDFAYNFTAASLTAVGTVGGLSAAICDEDGTPYSGAATVTGDEFFLKVTNTASKAGKITINGVAVDAKKDADEGDVAEIVVSGAGVEKTALEVAKAINYGVSFTAEDKKVPVFYAGSYNNGANDDTLEVTFKELAVDSWWSARATTLTFPEGVKVITANVKDTHGTCTITPAIDGNVVELTTTGHADNTKAEWDMDFNLSISPDFVGDITCTVGGPALKEDITVVVAEAQYPVTFEVEVSDVSIDYRNVAVGDITIKETYAGALEQNAVLEFIINKIDLEGKAKVEVVEGDIEVSIENTNGQTITLTVEDESYKAPSVIRIYDVEAYLDRTLPAGSYKLTVKSANADGTTKGTGDNNLIKNYHDKKADIKNATPGSTAWACFNVDKYTLADAYIEVVTAGRDQDDATFTTKVAVTIGANTMNVGQAVVALDVPAYISNGYTMLPVRAVADALSADAATVLWDDATKTVTIAFGARIISMTIGSKVMNINGVAIAMTAAPEITNGRTFLPVRDLGYALGLTDANIAWDDATKTATLN